MKQLLLFPLLLLTVFSAAQVGINAVDPDSSAALEVRATDKGILIPRITTSARTQMAEPAEGLLVYDLGTHSFWYFKNGDWVEIGGNTGGGLEIAPDLIPAPGGPGFEKKTENIAPNLGVVQGGAVSGTYLFVAAGSLYVFDISTPEAPILAQTFPLGYQIKEMEVSGNRLYTISTFPINGSYWLYRYDLTNAPNLSLMDSISTQYPPELLEVKDSVAFIYSEEFPDEAYIEPFELNNPASLLAYPITRLPVGITYMDLEGNRLACLNQHSFFLYDISYPWAIVETFRMDDDFSNPVNIHLAYPYFYFVSREKVRSFEFSDPTSADFLLEIPTEFTVFRSFLINDRLFLGGLGSGLSWIDVSDPLNLVEVNPDPVIGSSFYLIPLQKDLLFSLAYNSLYLLCVLDSTQNKQLLAVDTAGILMSLQEPIFEVENNLIRSKTGWGSYDFILGAPHPIELGQENFKSKLAFLKSHGGALRAGMAPVSGQIGQTSFAFGDDAVRAEWNNSVAFNTETTATSFSSTVIGRYNVGVGSTIDRWEDEESVFEIGIGDGEKNRNALTVLKDGRIGLQTVTAPEYALELPNSAFTEVGSIRATGFDDYSDRRIKSDIREIAYGLPEIMQLRPRSYLQHSSAFQNGQLVIDDRESSPKLGLIAQEVAEVIPEVVYQPKDENQDLWSMDYQKLIPVLIKGMQEQQAIIEQERSANRALEDRIEKLEGLINELLLKK